MKQILAALIVAAICSTAWAVVRTYTNEVKIESIKEIVLRIDKKIDRFECN